MRCRIRYNLESIQKVVVWMVLHTILLDPNGYRDVLYLYRNDDGRWNWNYNWLENDWNANHRSTSLATHFISPLISCRRSFVLEADYATHRTCVLLPQVVEIARRTFWYQVILFPTQSAGTPYRYPV